MTLALYAEIEKVDEDEERVRYRYTDIQGSQYTLVLNKATEVIASENGEDDMLYRAVARKIAAAWLDSEATPERLVVQS
ncbi:hypothetical protein ACLMAJ_26960 [Nocardia sp. KC 131]|uniref:hypothetical protein n=1 Tax=Nocardia arseniciresistens TaxID=3392119 RepID=UPI00398F2FB5